MAPNILASCSDAELRRFAICFVYCDRGAIDWEAASANFDPAVKVASFKTVTNRALSKTLRTIADGDTDETTSATTSPNKALKPAAGRKRKAAAEMNDTSSASPAKKGKAAAARASKAKGKKGGEAEPEAGSDEESGEAGQDDEDRVIVKAEQPDEDVGTTGESHDEV